MLGSSLSYSSVSRTSSYSSVRRPYAAAPHAYRFPFRLSHLYLLVSLAVLLMSWESVRENAAIASGGIPNEAIRLRILANSDSAIDQAVKRAVRDAVVAEMNGWAAGPQTIEQARAALQARMGDIEAVVARKLQARGFDYGFKAELGLAEFPTKIYGEKVYPAGDYEALRITLGAGDGQNWWCVLFPPLCFVDADSGEAVPKAEAAAAKGGAVQASASVQDGAKTTAAAPAEPGEAPQAKFFVWELLESLFAFLRGLFA